MTIFPKQIREMAKGRKTKNKNVVEEIERPNEQREQGLEEAAAAGMGLQELTAAAAEGSGGESMVPGDAGPPALSTLGDVAPQPAAVDPSSAGPPAGGVTAMAGLTIEQRGDATRDAFRRAARQLRCRTRATRGARAGRCSRVLQRQGVR